MKKNVTKRILIALVAVLGTAAVIVGGYILYLSLQYYRIEDGVALECQNGQSAVLESGKDYTAVTYNIGFGAYDHDFSFFMDSGTMLDGTEVRGVHARAQSLAIVEKNTAGAIGMLTENAPDFCLLQEVDVDSTRSFHVDQTQRLRDAMPGYGSVFTENFHSGYLCYPFSEPHGSVLGGLLTLSRFSVDAANRYSYPVDASFPEKFFDLDRCFMLLRLPIDNGKELVLINSHMSAYDKGGTVRARQLETLNAVLTAEAEKGNYVIVGGDFNHALCGTEAAFSGMQQIPEWVFTLSDRDIASGYHIVCADNVTDVATCRSTDRPYEKGVNYEAVLDGFIVSSNVTASAVNLDLDFAYSDHNPVLLTFSLN